MGRSWIEEVGEVAECESEDVGKVEPCEPEEVAVPSTD